MMHTGQIRILNSADRGLDTAQARTRKARKRTSKFLIDKRPIVSSIRQLLARGAALMTYDRLALIKVEGGVHCVKATLHRAFPSTSRLFILCQPNMLCKVVKMVLNKKYLFQIA